VSTSVSGGNPELVGMKGIDMLQHVVDRAGAHGLRVIIDRHDVAINEQPGLWYDNHYLASRLVSDWTTLAKRFYADDTVVAFELNANLAGTTTWGDDNPLTDWRLAAEKAGNAALLWNPDVLIIVDGIENAAGIRYIGGGNLAGARDAPVVLSSPDKLVYGAADFPPSAFTNAAQDQPWLTASSYPENLPGIWNEAWGYLVDDGRAVFLAEFGTAYATDSDKQWLGKLVPYLNDLGIGFGYWALNYGESHQAGLLDDAQWMTADPVKINAIEPLFE
jgi:endoglucanase